MKRQISAKNIYGIFCGLLAGIVLSLQAAHGAPIVSEELPDLVEKTLPGVVNVSSTTVINYAVPGWDDFMRFWGIPSERKQSSLGSGFIIDKAEGYVLTNDHVIEHATEVAVILNDKRSFKAKIIGKDQKMDLALLQIRGDDHKVPSDLVAVPLADSDKVRIAEPVFAVGNPFGLQHTVTVGIISAKNRTIGLGPFDNFLQTDASINPGNSGGPLFNMKGEVVGINSVIFSRTGQSGGLGFAIPINEAKRIVPDLKKYGRVPRPWLGLLAERITPAHQQYYNLPVSKGVLVFNLVQEAPADKAGLKLGDIITAIGDHPIEEPNDVEKVLVSKKPNQSVVLKVQRGRRSLEVKVNLEELPPLSQLPQGII
jgi:serine protease Do